MSTNTPKYVLGGAAPLRVPRNSSQPAWAARITLTIPQTAPSPIIHLEYTIDHEQKSTKLEPDATDVDSPLNERSHPSTPPASTNSSVPREVPVPASRNHTTRKPTKRRKKLYVYLFCRLSFCRLRHYSSPTSAFRVFPAFVFVKSYFMSLYLCPLCFKIMRSLLCTMYIINGVLINFYSSYHSSLNVAWNV